MANGDTHDEEQHRASEEGRSDLEATAEAGSDDRLAGLCLTCEARYTCRRDRPAGGVWHCEDYR